MGAAALLLPGALLAAALAPAAAAATRCTVIGDGARIGNDRIQLEVRFGEGALALGTLADPVAGTRLALGGELFTLKLRDGRLVPASVMRRPDAPRCVPVSATPGAVGAAARQAATELAADFTDAALGLTVEWRTRITAEGAYVRETFAITAQKELDVDTVTLFSSHWPGASVAGTADGVPIVTARAYAAIEHPMAHARVVSGEASASIRRALPLRPGVTVRYSTVLGVAAPGQMRRAFAAYLDEERAHPFRTFLHYNSWYDIGYFERYTQAQALAAIEGYTRELVRARHVTLDSFLFDDGWDDTSRLWTFHPGFPDGFDRLRAAAAAAGAAPGVWLSPWGGYGPPRQERLAAARAAGFEVDEQGIALSGPRYFAYFRAATLDLLRRSGINHFKLDGIGSPDKVTPGSSYDSDFAAAIALIDELRGERPDLYINLTTGTWPSPFWLMAADSIWRGGEDHEFAGTGTDRQRWITYRDSDTYGGIVRQSPLYPLNALMLHGIIYAHHARGLSDDPAGDLGDEVWSYFASGTGLQELYVSADLPTPAQWDLIAEAARWARERAPVLRDSHWIGGDPARGAVYGWAAFGAGDAVVALRNPAARPQHYRLDLNAALELPDGAPRRYRTRGRHGLAPPRSLCAAQPVDVVLPPYAVLVWDLFAADGHAGALASAAGSASRQCDPR